MAKDGSVMDMQTTGGCSFPQFQTQGPIWVRGAEIEVFKPSLKTVPIYTTGETIVKLQN